MAEISPQEFLEQLKKGRSLERADLSGMQLEGAVLAKANLARADLSGANLAGADLRGANLTSCSLREAYMPGALLEGARLRNADLEGANLSHADLLGADGGRANFEGANLEGAKLRGAKLPNAILTDANLGKADLANATLRSADFTDAYLGGADLTLTDARKATFEGTNLEESKLGQADLRECDLTQAVLDGADLDGTRLYGAIVTAEQLSRARVTWIDVSRDGDASLREEGESVGAFLTGPSGAAAVTSAPAPRAPEGPSTRYFGPGDVLKNADLEFGPNSTVHVEGSFDTCDIKLAEGAELLVGPTGLVRDCTIRGAGRITVEGRLVNEGEERSVSAAVFVVRKSGLAVTRFVQPRDATRFGFEPGCVLRLDIKR